MADLKDLQRWLEHQNVRAFLRAIRLGESSPGDDEAYRALYGWRPGNGKVFGSFDDHPRIRTYETHDEFIRDGDNADYTTAAGAYQIVERTWDGLVRQYGFPDFSPGCQDEAAVALIIERKAIQDVAGGNIEAAVKKCRTVWASIPGSGYGQPTVALQRFIDVYKAYGGSLGEPATDSEAPMAVPLLPIFTALLPTITNLIPALAQVFKPGSEVAQRNVAAATVVSNALVEATKTPNLMAAVEAIQNDGEARAAATAAVTSPEVWNQLVEVGGGVPEARKSASSSEQIDWWKNPAMVFWGTLLPVIYGAAFAVLFGKRYGLSDFSDEVKMMVLTAIFTGILGAGTGFFLGSSLSSQKKDATLLRK